MSALSVDGVAERALATAIYRFAEEFIPSVASSPRSREFGGTTGRHKPPRRNASRARTATTAWNAIVSRRRLGKEYCITDPMKNTCEAPGVSRRLSLVYENSDADTCVHCGFASENLWRSAISQICSGFLGRGAPAPQRIPRASAHHPFLAVRLMSPAGPSTRVLPTAQGQGL